MRVLGVDFGFKRIGLAVTDSAVGLPRPLSVMTATGTLKRDAESIAAVAKVESVDEIVVGLPLERGGVEGRMAGVCRQLGEHLQGHGYPIHFVDESMTSYASEGQMIEAGVKASVRKRRLDSEAAALILERFLRGA
jgi:putative Holliday junction resolvase